MRRRTDLEVARRRVVKGTMDERSRGKGTNERGTREEHTASEPHSRSGERSGERPAVRATSKRALVLVDLVPALVSGPVPPPGVADVVRYVQGELRYFRERDRLVLFSVAEAFVGGGAQIVKELTPRAHELVIARTKPSIFSSTELCERLVEAGVKRVTLVGIGTAGAIAVSAADALTRGYGVTVPDPCVCDFVVDDHQAALRLIRDVWTPLFHPGTEGGEEVTAPGVPIPART